jgi:predicted GNAT superfamily acetyltransferase
MFGIKRTKGRRKKKIYSHGAAVYPKQKGGGIGDLFGLKSYYKSKSKKEQKQMDDWTVKNL